MSTDTIEKTTHLQIDQELWRYKHGIIEETSSLAQVAMNWKAKADDYFSLAETEADPLGKKFYESSAITLFNCIRDLERVAGIMILNPLDEASLLPKLPKQSSEAQT
jgi:hypothetical protein